MKFPAQNVQLFTTHVYAVNQSALEALLLCNHPFQQTLGIVCDHLVLTRDSLLLTGLISNPFISFDDRTYFYMNLYNIRPLQSLVLWDSDFLPNVLQTA